MEVLLVISILSHIPRMPIIQVATSSNYYFADVAGFLVFVWSLAARKVHALRDGILSGLGSFRQHYGKGKKPARSLHILHKATIVTVFPNAKPRAKKCKHVSYVSPLPQR
jgi:hypothetical protein